MMDEMYGFLSTATTGNYHVDYDHRNPPAARDSYDQQQYEQAVFGSGQMLLPYSSTPPAPASVNNSTRRGSAADEELEEDFSSENRAKIMSHPLYPKLLQAYISCQKVGAPPDVANLFDEIFRENDLCCRRSAACSSSFGDDPELDEFMETYCEVLNKYRSDLERPFDEATTFLNNIQTQLTNLCNGVSRTNHHFSVSWPGGTECWKLHRKSEVE